MLSVRTAPRETPMGNTCLLSAFLWKEKPAAIPGIPVTNYGVIAIVSLCAEGTLGAFGP